MEIRINNLNKNFVAALNRMQKKYGSAFLSLNNFSNDKLNYSEFIDNFTQDNNRLVDVSINQSANMAQKDIVTLNASKQEPQDKLLAYNKTYYEITKKYGRDAANTWLENIWNGSLYMHDAPSSTYMPYCWATSLQPVAERGLYFIDQFPTGPAQHLSTFCDHVLETVCFLSNRQSGGHKRPFCSFS